MAAVATTYRHWELWSGDPAGAGGPPPYYPETLSPWLYLTAYGDTATNFTLSGSNVEQWNDLSGNARHHTQSTMSYQPTYEATGLDGTNPAVRFTRAAQQHLKLPAQVTIGGSYTAYVVVKLAATTNSHWILNDKADYGTFLLQTGGHELNNYPPDYASWSGAGLDTNKRLWSADANAGPTTAALYRDNVAIASAGTSGGTVWNLRHYGLGIRTAADGSPYAAANALDGHIAEVLIYAANHDTTTREAVQAAMATRWGITL